MKNVLLALSAIATAAGCAAAGVPAVEPVCTLHVSAPYDYEIRSYANDGTCQSFSEADVRFAVASSATALCMDAACGRSEGVNLAFWGTPPGSFPSTFSFPPKGATSWSYRDKQRGFDPGQVFVGSISWLTPEPNLHIRFDGNLSTDNLDEPGQTKRFVADAWISFASK